jgi:hypothetical protein
MLSSLVSYAVADIVFIADLARIGNTFIILVFVENKTSTSASASALR